MDDIKTKITELYDIINTIKDLLPNERFDDEKLNKYDEIIKLDNIATLNIYLDDLLHILLNINTKSLFVYQIFTNVTKSAIDFKNEIKTQFGIDIPVNNTKEEVLKLFVEQLKTLYKNKYQELINAYNTLYVNNLILFKKVFEYLNKILTKYFNVNSENDYLIYFLYELFMKLNEQFF